MSIPIETLIGHATPAEVAELFRAAVEALSTEEIGEAVRSLTLGQRDELLAALEAAEDA